MRKKAQATDKRETTDNNDIWASAPRNKKGDYLTSPTNESGYVTATEKNCCCSFHPIKLNDKVGVLSTKQIAPGQAANIYYWGPEGAEVGVKVSRVPNSGGHFHGGKTEEPDAVGSVAPNFFELGNSNVQHVVYRAPLVSGSVVVRATFSTGDVVDLIGEIMVRGLRPLSETAALKLKPPLPEHPSPYWVSKRFERKLTTLASAYHARTTKPLTVTDASLRDGGRFDLRQDWRPPHHEHMGGNEADIRRWDMTAEDIVVLYEEAEKVGIAILEESDHWHFNG